MGSYTASFIGSEGAFKGLGDWYLAIDRPRWAPPFWLFSPLWTVLYGLVAVAGWIAWNQSRRSNPGLILFWTQLAFGAAWPWLFFARHLLAASAIEVTAQWALVLATTVLFLRTRPLAGLLMVPYLAWVAWVAALTITIWKAH